VRPADAFGAAEVTHTDRVTLRTGPTHERDGRATPEYTVLVFPQARERWFAPSRHVKQIRADTSGGFRFVGLPPGDYFLAALTDLTGVNLGDAAFLEAVSAAAIPITLAEGEQKRQDVKLAGG
jgi:hypothetical protein